MVNGCRSVSRSQLQRGCFHDAHRCKWDDLARIVAAKDYIFTAQTGTMSAFGTGRKRQVRLTKDQQSVDNTARGDGNAEGRQR
jgi:hypothetical protein